MTHPLWEANRACTACNLVTTCAGPVPGDGPTNALVMLVGEGPGANEDQSGRPFTGQAGKVLAALLSSCNLSRDEVYITNVVKCRPPSNRNPKPDEIDACVPRWLNLELQMVKPTIVVALGAFATRALSGLTDTMDHLHGKPLQGVQSGDYKIPILLPVYHPAAGLHNTRLIRQIGEDFDVLKGLVSGRPPESFYLADEHPSPDYKEVDSVEEVSDFLRGCVLVALDVETVDDRLWSVQLSKTSGKAIFISVDLWRQSRRLWADYQGRVIVHNALFELGHIPIPLDHLEDTMIMAYLLGLPQGLKTLARDLCGMTMQSYPDLMRPTTDTTIRSYLEEVLRQEEIHPWPECPPIEVTKWDNKAGRVITKTRKPKRIAKKVPRILAHDNPLAEWLKLDPLERAVAEDQLGPVGEATIADIPHDQAVYYAARDPDATLRVYNILSQRIHSEGQSYVYRGIDLPSAPIARKMMNTGMAIDADYLDNLAAELTASMAIKADEAADLAAAFMDGIPVRFNPNSSTQVANLMYGRPPHGLGYPITATTKTNLPSTDDRELKKITLDGTIHPIIESVLAYRHMAKMKDSYAETLPKFAVYDAITPHDDTFQYPRVHPDIRTTGTETGRFNVRNPAVQTIPMRSELGRRIRAAFVAEPPYLLTAADYNQLEMRIAMHFYGAVNGIKLFIDGRDLHTETAALINGIPLEEAAKDRYRYPCKRCGFGIVYGISGSGLYATFVEEQIEGLDGWSVDRCQELIDEWVKVYPEVRTGQQRMIDEGRRNGYCMDMFGRRRWIPELRSPIRTIREAGERAAGNMPVQSGASGIVRAAMHQIESNMVDDTYWLNQIHDELVMEMHPTVLARALTQYITIMTGIVSLSLPLVVSAKVGINLRDMEVFNVGTG